MVAGRLEAIYSELDGLKGRLRSTIAASQVTVVTSLGAALDAASRCAGGRADERDHAAVQLAVLAGYALVLTAAFSSAADAETALLRARGAGAGQLGAAALLEALVLAVPIAIAAPLIAVALRHLQRSQAASTRSASRSLRGSRRSAQLMAAVTAGACAPGPRHPLAPPGPATSSALPPPHSRQARSGVVERVGLDLALLVVAAVGLWQLRQFGAPLSGAGPGPIGVLSPLLVAAPAIGLLAGAVVALHILPLVARLADIGMTHGRGLVTLAGAWQTHRRPLRYAPAALLLIVTMALGVFAASYGHTWATSQADQAAYQVGPMCGCGRTDLGGGPGPIDLPGAAYRALGASDVMAVGATRPTSAAEVAASCSSSTRRGRPTWSRSGPTWRTTRSDR